MAAPTWVAPPMGSAKVKVDGAVGNSSNHGSVSDIHIDTQGNYLGSSTQVFVGVTNPTTLEALACREAMSLSFDLLQTSTIVASNCKGVMSNIKDGTSGKHGHIIWEIKIMASEFQDCSFIFGGRASNLEAHSLAKHALSLSAGHHLWLLQPPTNCIPLNIIEQ
jgi:hypothetical protein